MIDDLAQPFVESFCQYMLIWSNNNLTRICCGMIGYKNIGVLHSEFKNLVYSILGSFYLGTDTNAVYNWIQALLIHIQLRQGFRTVVSIKTFSRSREFNEGRRRMLWKKTLYFKIWSILWCRRPATLFFPDMLPTEKIRKENCVTLLYYRTS